MCYRLSQYGWNVLPTSRNARGIDLVIYSQDARTTKTIQVKGQSKKLAVVLGKHTKHLFADFVIVCTGVIGPSPECFILTPDEVRDRAKESSGTSGISYWLPTPKYATSDFRERWDRIGDGAIGIVEELQGTNA